LGTRAAALPWRSGTLFSRCLNLAPTKLPPTLRCAVYCTRAFAATTPSFCWYGGSEQCYLLGREQRRFSQVDVGNIPRRGWDPHCARISCPSCRCWDGHAMLTSATTNNGALPHLLTANSSNLLRSWRVTFPHLRLSRLRGARNRSTSHFAWRAWAHGAAGARYTTNTRRRLPSCAVRA